MRLFFGSATRRHVAEAPHSPYRDVVDALRLRVTLERAPIFEFEHVVAGFLGMTIELDDLGQELIRIKKLVERRVDGSLIVAARENVGWDLPHVRHLLVEAEDLAVEIDDEDAIGGRFQRRTQEREGSACFGLRFASQRDVLDEGNDVHGIAAGRTNDGDGEIHPDDAPILADIALFQLVLGKLAGPDPTNEIQAGGEVVRMCELLDLELQELFALVTSDLAKTLIDRNPILTQGEVGDPDRRLLEGRQQEVSGPAEGNGVFGRPTRNRGGRGKNCRFRSGRKWAHAISSRMMERLTRARGARVSKL